MFSTLHTIRFFRIFLSQKFAPISVEGHQIEQSNGTKLQFDEYHPNGKCHGSIVFTHGMTRKAYRDERIEAFCRAMATMGYRMLVPLYPKIQALDVTADSIDDIAQSLQSFLQHGYGTNNCISIFSVSFSGAQALRAISRPEIAPQIKAVLALGTANSYVDTFAKILDPNGVADAYVKMLLLHNILLHGPNEYPLALESAINAAIDDAYEHNNSRRLLKLGEKLPPDLQSTYLNLIHSLFNSNDIYCQNVKTIENIQQEFLNKGHLRNVKAAVSLIHSDKDKVLMPCESQALYETLQKYHIKSRLTVTPLLDHVNTQFSIKQIKAAWQLLQGFNFFFKNATVA